MRNQEVFKEGGVTRCFSVNLITKLKDKACNTVKTSGERGVGSRKQQGESGRVRVGRRRRSQPERFHFVTMGSRRYLVSTIQAQLLACVSAWDEL
jgi:hypothetical protein